MARWGGGTVVEYLQIQHGVQAVVTFAPGGGDRGREWIVKLSPNSLEHQLLWTLEIEALVCHLKLKEVKSNMRSRIGEMQGVQNSNTSWSHFKQLQSNIDPDFILSNTPQHIIRSRLRWHKKPLQMEAWAQGTEGPCSLRPTFLLLMHTDKISDSMNDYVQVWLNPCTYKTWMLLTIAKTWCCTWTAFSRI